MTRTIGLVACCKSKAPSARPAERLYTGTLFHLARKHCLRHCDGWFILSAEHGLLRPEKVIEPYERTLKGATRYEKAGWAAVVKKQLERKGLLAPGVRLVAHAGKDYLDPLRAAGVEIHEDFGAGLGIGRRLALYKRELAQ